MKNLITLVAYVYCQIGISYAQPSVEVKLDDCILSNLHTNPCFDSTSIFDISIVNDNDDNRLYRIDKVLVEIELESIPDSSGDDKIIRYQGQKFYARCTNSSRRDKEYQLAIEGEHFDATPTQRIFIKDFEGIGSLCVRKIIIQIDRVSFKKKGERFHRKVSSNFIDPSDTFESFSTWDLIDD